jgi:uncharacterized C2H2 Zn-finger protein
MKLGDTLKVTRNDIQDFPGDTINLIMDLQKEGWRAQRSNRNHVMLLAPDGVSRYSVSRNANSSRYLAEDVRRYNAGESRVQMETEPMEDEVVTDTVKFTCPHTDCPRAYGTQEKLNVHIAVDHEGWLKCPDCDEVRQTKRLLSIHRAKKHGYESPRKAQRKNQEEARSIKKVEEALLRVDQRENQKINDAILDSLVVHRKGDGERVDLKQFFAKPPSEVFQEIGSDIMEYHNTAFDEQMQVFDQTMVDIPPNDLEVATEMLRQSHLAPEGLPLEDVYRLARNQLDSYRDPKVVRTHDDLEFLDTRDSWTLDISNLGRMRLRDIEEMMKAAGLSLEIRVWKEKE